MALSKLKKMIVEDLEDDDDEVEETKKVPTTGSGKMILLEPRAYSESQQIADHLKKRNTVVVNMKRVTPDQAKRIVDFLSGTVYALAGQAYMNICRRLLGEEVELLDLSGKHGFFSRLGSLFKKN